MDRFLQSLPDSLVKFCTIFRTFVFFAVPHNLSALWLGPATPAMAWVMKKSEFKRQGLATLKAGGRASAKRPNGPRLSEDPKAAGLEPERNSSSVLFKTQEMFSWEIVHKRMIWRELRVLELFSLKTHWSTCASPRVRADYFINIFNAFLVLEQNCPEKSYDDTKDYLMHLSLMYIKLIQKWGTVQTSSKRRWHPASFSSSHTFLLLEIITIIRIMQKITIITIIPIILI